MGPNDERMSSISVHGHLLLGLAPKAVEVNGTLPSASISVGLGPFLPAAGFQQPKEEPLPPVLFQLGPNSESLTQT